VAKGNVMGNQVQKIKNTPSLVSFAPDVILLAAGTNDSDSTGATFSESLFTDSNGFVSLGTPTFDSADTYMANRRTMAGAMRYCITELEKIYPNAQIFICTPIQSSQSIHQYVNTKNKQELQKAVGQRMSVNIIDVGGGCGIYGDFEWNGSEWTEEEPDSHAGRDLYDGLHPNNSGSQKMAKYIYNEILRMLKK
jgi:lysophospholipase L1-like esterase